MKGVIALALKSVVTTNHYSTVLYRYFAAVSNEARAPARTTSRNYGCSESPPSFGWNGSSYHLPQ
jgi:hypothetical protein